MSDAVAVAIIGGTVSLLLVIANAIAKRLSKATHEEPDSATIDDGALSDLNRATRSLGENLHDETRALIRRVASEMNHRLDGLEDRFDRMDRRHRDNMEEWREMMKPTAFGTLVDKLHKID